MGIPGGAVQRSTIDARSWLEMTTNDKWLLRELWNGNLLHIMREAESTCHGVKAEPFRVDDDDP